MALTLAEANRIVEGALAQAAEFNIKVSGAVCDAGGRLVALNRMDGAIWAGAYGSQGKAVASAAFGRPSGELTERANQPTPQGIAAAEVGGRRFEGQPVSALEQFETGQIMEDLAVPVEKTGRILVLEDTVRSLGRAIENLTTP